MRVLVTTWYDDRFAAIGDLALASCARYCRAQGYELRVPSVPRADRPPAWHKIEILRALLDEAPDLVLWIDADAMIVRTDRPAHAELPADRAFGLVKHVLDGVTTVNTGVLMLRATDPARELLDEIWRQEKCREHRWWENAAMMEGLGYRKALADGREDAPEPRWERHLHWLAEEWNTLPGARPAEPPIVRHYAGRSLEYRLANMRADAREALSGDDSRLSRPLLTWAQRVRRAVAGP